MRSRGRAVSGLLLGERPCGAQVKFVWSSHGPIAGAGRCGAIDDQAEFGRGCVKTWVNFELGGRATPPHHERIAYSAILAPNICALTSLSCFHAASTRCGQ